MIQYRIKYDTLILLQTLRIIIERSGLSTSGAYNKTGFHCGGERNLSTSVVSSRSGKQMSGSRKSWEDLVKGKEDPQSYYLAPDFTTIRKTKRALFWVLRLDILNSSTIPYPFEISRPVQRHVCTASSQF
jgi:hypothetical protein